MSDLTAFGRSLSERAEEMERIIFPFLPKAESYNAQVCEAMNYAVKNGGKRLRPILMCEFYSFGDRPAEYIYPFAAALEFIHCYSLIHDDMPCMDDSGLRRGKPSVHVKFGEWTALLAGDGLLNYAFETVLNSGCLTEIGHGTALRCLRILAEASGIYGMAGGQNADLASVKGLCGEDELSLLQEKKTGALIRAAGRIGCTAAGADPETLRAADEYCGALGRAFQISDDILDATSSAEQLGKPAGKDAEKPTFVTVLGLREAEKRADMFTAAAAAAADRLQSRFLRDLAEYLNLRRK